MSATSSGIRAPAAAPTGPARRGSAAVRAVASLARVSRRQSVDLAGAGLLTLLAIVGFATTFDGIGWLVGGVLGVVLGLGAAHVGSRLPLRALATAGLAAVAYLGVGGLVTGSYADLPRVAVKGWKELLTTMPPVESRGPLLALPFLFGLIGAAAAYGVARRWPGAMRALVVPAALLVVSLLLGTTTPASILLQGGGSAVVAIGWATLRAARGRAALQEGSGRTARALTAAALLGLALVAGLLVGPRLPGADEAGRTVWRTAIEPPFDVAQYPSPLAGFRRYTEPNAAALYERPLLTVAGVPAGTPLRIATLDSYDGTVWGAASTAAGAGTQGGGSAFRRVGPRLTPAGPTSGVETNARIAVPEGGWTEVWLPTLGTVTGLRFAGPRSPALAADLRFNVDTGTGVLPARLQAGDGYEVTAYLPPAAPAPTEVALATGATGESQGLAFLDARIDTWSGRESTPWRKLMATATAMRTSGAYTDGGPDGSYQNVFLPGHSLARITRFVKASQLAGDDEQYAATLALVATRLGVPARVVLGAIPDATGVVRGKDVHAWVEVARLDGGWQAILPDQFVPDRTKAPDQQQLRSEEKKTGAMVPPPAANNPPSILQGPDQAQNATQNRSQGAKRSFLDPSTWPAWLRFTVGYLGPPVGLALAAYLALRILKALRRSRRRTRGSAAQRVEGGWAELVDAARDLGMPLPPKATRLEQAGALDRLAEADADTSLVPMARSADAFVFGAHMPSDADASGYWQGVGLATARMRRDVTAWRRLRGAWSTRSLRGGRPLRAALAGAVAAARGGDR
ncbi:MAG: transglutaminase-like domain-containing protein [Dermatophilaceae bacterium]